MMDRNTKHRTLARMYWETAGRPAGRDLEFWLEAERDVDHVHLFPPRPRFLQLMHVYPPTECVCCHGGRS
jgi:hypothetical protein